MAYRDQHFLVDERVADRILDYADLSPDESVLEIGPGRGVLTERLVEGAERLYVVELDEDLAREVEAGFPGVEVLRGDALEVDFPEFEVCVSNLPYSISGDVTFKILRGEPDRAVLMYQKEFADRLSASPGTKEYGRLTVGVNLFADVEVLETVPRTAFDPRPKVESAVVRLTRREPDYGPVDEEVFLSVLKAVFTQRRKKLRNALLNTLHISGLEEERVESLETDLLEKRPDAVEPEEYAELCRRLSKRS